MAWGLWASMREGNGAAVWVCESTCVSEQSMLNVCRIDSMKHKCCPCLLEIHCEVYVQCYLLYVKV